MYMYKILFLNLLILSSLVSISSFNWMGMWMGLEMNLLSIIPLLKSKMKASSEASIKYFVTQALASTLILFSIILIFNQKSFNLSNLNLMLMNSALLTKLGAAPFHFWFPEIMEGLNWLNNLILLTWQKIAPMILLMYNSQMSMFFIMIIIFSMIISSLMGLNQMSLRKILTFSSINNIGWMIPTILYSYIMWLIYFIIYTMISLNLVIIFMFYKIFYINQMNLIFMNNKMIKFIIFFNLLNLGGLPPFLGFYSKWLVFNLMLMNNLKFITLIMILFTLIVLYYYIRIMMSTLMLSSNFYNIMMFNNKNIFLMNYLILFFFPLMIYL